MLTFPYFSNNAVRHGVFDRHGGVSSGAFSSLNVSYGIGDECEAVRTNRRIFKDHLGLERLVSVKQVHGDAVLVVNDATPTTEEIHGYDAMITNISDIGLMVQQADCQAILLHDPKCRAVGIIHSGWRGSVLNIIGKTVAKMTALFQSEPQSIRAAISPSLGPCCAEFIHYKKELPEPFHSFQVKANHFDFRAISRSQLIQAGVKRDNIAVAGICTVCNDNYFSYRRDKHTGRFGSVICLSSPPCLQK